MEIENFILMSDSYKYGHYLFYPDNTTTVYSYGEARENATYDKTVMFLMQYLVKKYFVGKVVTQKHIDEAKKVIDNHLGPNVFNEEGWQYILDKYDGKLPLEIRAIDEGTAVPKGNALFDIVNTDPKCYWLTSFCETLLMNIWLGCSVATLTMETRKVLLSYLDRTSDDPNAVIDFMFHNFGARSAAGPQAAGITSAAHGLGFMGTDSVIGLPLIKDFYLEQKPNLYSVAASEHSVASAAGRDGEFEVVEKALKVFPTGILSYVIDTYDWKNFVDVMGTKYKDKISERDGKFVFRPDSGSHTVVTLSIIQMLDKYFGSTVNSKGYKVLNPKVGVLWGDGINLKGIREILDVLEEAGYSAENLIVGQGGVLTHSGVSRDLQSFAIKSSYQVADGIGKNIFKDPIDGGKKSKKGRLAVIKEGGVFKTLEEVEGVVEGDLLKPVFRNGRLLKEVSYSAVKKNLVDSW